MDSRELRNEMVKAALEGRYATACYLMGCLPQPRQSVLRTSDQSNAISGSIEPKKARA
jgi:hypothetical protein